MSETKYAFGTFVWRELVTTDAAASTTFYGELFGWKIKKASMPGMDYWLLSAGEREVAGLFQLSAPGVPAHWQSYVSVPDVDAAVEAAKAGGGALLSGPHDVPTVGRMAGLRDPQGGVFSVFKSTNGDHVSSDRPKEGEFCWEQLSTTDIPAAKVFYGKVAGWQVKQMAPGMDFFAVDDSPRGGVASYGAPPPGVPTNWTTFVVVSNLADANARALRLGGKVMMERIDVPTVGSFSVVQDNVGAIICPFQAIGA